MKKLFLTIILVFGFIQPPFSISQIYQNWASRYNGIGNNNDVSMSVINDSYGSIFITGRSVGYNDWDCATVKYNRCGKQKWLNRYNGGTYSTDWSNSIAINATNEVIVGGHYNNLSIFENQYLAIQYDNNGNQSALLADGPYGYDGFVKVKSSGNYVYAIGNSQNYSPGYLYYDIVLFKLQKTGNSLSTVWSRNFGLQNYDEVCYDLFVDINSNIYIAGSRKINNDDWTIIKYDQNGNLLWSYVYAGNGNGLDVPASICADDYGNVFVTGRSKEYENPDNDSEPQETFTTLKLYANGNLHWVAKYFGAGEYRHAEGTSITIYNNEPFVTGFAKIDNYYHVYTTIRYNTYGILQWLATYKYSGVNADNIAKVIKHDDWGNIYVTGESMNQSGTNYRSKDIATVKYTSDGEDIWVMRYNGEANGGDSPNDLIVNGSPVYVTGFSDRDPDYNVDNYDYITLSYSNAWPVCDDEDSPNLSVINEYKSVSRIDEKKSIIIGKNGLVKMTSDKGNNWRNLNVGLTNHLQTVEFLNSTGVITSDNGKILISTNYGTNWNLKNTGSTNSLNTVCLLENGNIILAGDKGTVIRTTNTGITWQNLNFDTTLTIKSIYFVNQSMGFLTCADGKLFKTNNSGINWTLVNLSNSSGINSIKFLNTSTGFLACDNGKLLKTTNNGLYWQDVLNGYQSNLNKIIFLNEKTGYICGNNGLMLYTENSGFNWINQNIFSATDIISVAFLDSGNGLAISSEGKILRTNLGETDYSETESQFTLMKKDSKPDNVNEFRLFPNYPNPFNPVTEIEYYLPHESHVKISIYDLKGSLVTTMFNGIKEQGIHSVQVNLSNLASGVYFYEMCILDRASRNITFQQTKKMVMIK